MYFFLFSPIFSQRQKLDTGLVQNTSMTDNITKRLQSFSYQTPSLYGDLSSAANTYSIAAKMGLHVPNLAPDIVPDEPVAPPVTAHPPVVFNVEDVSKEPKKKKYAKEMWPGKKPVHSLLV